MNPIKDLKDVFGDALIAANDAIFKNGEEDSKFMKEMLEKKLGVTLDVTLIEAVLQGLLIAATIVQVGEERKSSFRDVYAILGKQTADLLRLKKQLTNTK